MQRARKITLPFILFELFPFELCASQKSCPLLTWKPPELNSRNFIQISISMRWRAECKNGNSAFYTLSYFPWSFVHHKNRVHSITWKPLKLYSRNFIQVSTNMSRRAECKNSNSVIYTLWVISLGTLSITKTIIYDYFIPGYDCAVVNYIDRYLY